MYNGIPVYDWKDFGILGTQELEGWRHGLNFEDGSCCYVNCYIIGVGRFRILGGPRFRILGGQGGGAEFPAGT